MSDEDRQQEARQQDVEKDRPPAAGGMVGEGVEGVEGVEGAPPSKPRNLAELVERHRPLIGSICRRYFRQPQDIEDAVQETLVRLVRDVNRIHTSTPAWLSATAHSTCNDLLRRSIRQRRRVERLQPGTAVDHSADLRTRILHEATRQRLPAALAALEDASRELVVERFLRRTPLRIIASRQSTSVATISRKTTAALSHLAAILRDMGVQDADELALAEHFGDPTCLLDSTTATNDDLRFEAKWPSTNQEIELPGTPTPATLFRPGGPCAPGWNRPIRIGALVSYRSLSTPGYRDIIHRSETQVTCLRALDGNGFHLVGIAEGGTTSRGVVERTLREYDLTAGLIDAADAEGLATLDVILLGVNFALDESVAAAVGRAVRGGVGLLNDFWVAEVAHRSSDPASRAYLDLMLGDSPVYSFHTPGWCGMPEPATVICDHPPAAVVQSRRQLAHPRMRPAVPRGPRRTGVNRQGSARAAPAARHRRTGAGPNARLHRRPARSGPRRGRQHAGALGHLARHPRPMHRLPAQPAPLARRAATGGVLVNRWKLYDSPIAADRLSIVIPALNEAEHLPRTVATLQSAAVWPGRLELIISDCHSHDATRTVAEAIGAIVTCGGSSRAEAMNHGAGVATGNVLLFLHADTLLPDRFDALICRALADDRLVGGAFDFAFGRDLHLDALAKRKLELVRLLNRGRFRWHRTFYGDQAIFCRREVFDHIGGYQPIPLFEDVRFSQAMRRLGRTAILQPPVETSPRRFVEQGILWQMFRDMFLMAADGCGICPRRMWQRYNAHNHNGHHQSISTDVKPTGNERSDDGNNDVG